MKKINNKPSVLMCPKCFSFNIESHNVDEEYTTVTYVCPDCHLTFNNYDYLLNWKLREKVLAIKTGEATVGEVIDTGMRSLDRKGAGKFFDDSHIENMIYAGYTPLDYIRNLCFVETMVDHWNNILYSQKHKHRRF